MRIQLIRISRPDYESLSFIYDLGSISSQSSVFFTVGITRDPAIQYVDGNGKTETRSSYFWSSYPNISVAVSASDRPNPYGSSV